MIEYGIWNTDKLRTEGMFVDKIEAEKVASNCDHLEVKEYEVVEINSITQEILKSFRKINNGIYFNTEETTVLSASQDIIGQCKSFKMPKEFALNSLAKFLSMLNFINTDKIYLSDTHLYMKADDSEDDEEKVFECPFSLETGIPKIRPHFEEALQPFEIKFNLSKENIKDMLSACGILAIDTVTFNFKGDQLTIDVSDLDAKSKTDMCHIKVPIENPNNMEYKLLLKSNEFHLLLTDYDCMANDFMISFKAKPIKDVDVELTYYLNSDAEID